MRTDKIRVTMLVDVPAGMEAIDVDIATAVEAGFRTEAEGFHLDVLEEVVDINPVFQVTYTKVIDVRATDRVDARNRADEALASLARDRGVQGAQWLRVNITEEGL